MTLIRSLAALLGCIFICSAAHAEAPFAKSQAPGWYRMKIGDFEVTALSDGTVALPVDKLLKQVTPQRVDELLKRSYLSLPLVTSINGYLVNTGSKLVLIDSGCGQLWDPSVGKLVDNLKASGYQPEQVDEIYITHMHFDHVGGLVKDGKAVFPNAIVRADQREGDFWLSQANLDKSPADAKDFFKNAQTGLAPYVAAGKLKPFSGATELVPGIRAIPAAGHTPGHTIYAIESKGQRLVFWGDLMHVAAVQFPVPSVTIQFDTDSKSAAPARSKNFADAASKGYYVAGTHLAFPGVGHLRAEGKGYQWLPVNYNANP